MVQPGLGVGRVKARDEVGGQAAIELLVDHVSDLPVDQVAQVGQRHLQRVHRLADVAAVEVAAALDAAGAHVE